MKIRDVYNLINAFAPYENQESFDNSGLNIGDMEAEVTGVMLAVDVSLEAVEQAYQNGCNLLLTHHPIIFRPLANVVESDYVGKVVRKAISLNVHCLSAHTNMDKAKGGINDRLALLLGGVNCYKLLDVDEYATFFEVEKQPLNEFAAGVSSILADECVSFIGNHPVKKVAVVGGAGGDYPLINYCIQENATLVTCELKHHLARMIEDIKGNFIAVGHFTSEKIFVTICKELLAGKAPLYVCMQTNPFHSAFYKE